MVDKWIQGAREEMEKKGTVGSLRSALHAKEGQAIPSAKLSKALHSRSPALRKKAQFAENVRGARHAGQKAGLKAV